MEKNTMKNLMAGLVSVFVFISATASPNPQPEKVLALKGTVIGLGRGIFHKNRGQEPVGNDQLSGILVGRI